jgi:hypothetical protein
MQVGLGYYCKGKKNQTDRDHPAFERRYARELGLR